MMFRTHLAASLLILLVLAPFYESKIFLIIFILGTIMPDIDTPTSFLGRRFKLFGWLFLHRGIFHSVWMLLVLSLIVWIASPMAGTAFGLGYGLHLLLDAFNHAGIRPFHPLSKLKIKGIFKTNGIFENALFIACLVASLMLII